MKIALKIGVCGFFTITALMLGTASLPAASASSTPTPVVVELYTSQGCSSSCPPADALLGELSAMRAAFRAPCLTCSHIIALGALNMRGIFSFPIERYAAVLLPSWEALKLQVLGH